MSLRVRLIVSIILVLMLSLGVGGGVAGWHAVRSVRAEMQAALEVGAQTLRDRLADLPEPGTPAAGAEPMPARHDGRAPARVPPDRHGLDDAAATAVEVAMVHSFDGDRHVRAVLHDRTGQDRAVSALHMPGFSMPTWFVSFLTPTLAPLRFGIDAEKAIMLEPDSRNEIGEVWIQFKDDLTGVALFCFLSVTLVSLVVQHALKPLDRFSAALVALGDGDCTVRLKPQGPPELMRLAQGINSMAAQLQAAQARNVRLTEQLLTLQEEERADLARDLHDEIGPLLFAVHLDAAAIGQAAASQTAASQTVVSQAVGQVAERAHAIREAVGHMQRHVRAMLHRLRPPSPADAGLDLALDNLLAFWRARCPAVEFRLNIEGDEDTLDSQATTTIYRLAQESLNNAVRHGRPSRVEIAVAISSLGEVRVRIADNGIGRLSAEPGFGLTGMRERVEALGGQLCTGDDSQGKGFIVTASLPHAAVLEDA